jgi:hypothetical protein
LRTRGLGLLVGAWLGQLGASTVGEVSGHRASSQRVRCYVRQALNGGRAGVDVEKPVGVSLLSACGLSADQQWGHQSAGRGAARAEGAVVEATHVRRAGQ